MQQLHLVGFTTDLEGLIFSARKGAKSGGYLVVLDDKLRAAIEDALRLRDGHAPMGDLGEEGDLLPRPRRPRPQSTLSPREIQARLRMGSTIAEVADEAGVDEEWVGRFAAPILAEQAQVVGRARRLTFAKARLGESAQPLGVAVRWNLADKNVRMLDDDYDTAWSAYNLQGTSWVVRFQYLSRQKRHVAEWEVDLRESQLYARNRTASELGYVDPARRRRRPPVLEPSPRETPARPVDGSAADERASDSGAVGTGGPGLPMVDIRVPRSAKADRAAAVPAASRPVRGAKQVAKGAGAGARGGGGAGGGAGRGASSSRPSGAGRAAGGRSGATKAAGRPVAGKTTGATKAAAGTPAGGRAAAGKTTAGGRAGATKGAKGTAGKPATGKAKSGSARATPAKGAGKKGRASGRASDASGPDPAAAPPPRLEEPVRPSHLARPLSPMPMARRANATPLPGLRPAPPAPRPALSRPSPVVTRAPDDHAWRGDGPDVRSASRPSAAAARDEPADRAGQGATDPGGGRNVADRSTSAEAGAARPLAVPEGVRVLDGAPGDNGAPVQLPRPAPAARRPASASPAGPSAPSSPPSRPERAAGSDAAVRRRSAPDAPPPRGDPIEVDDRPRSATPPSRGARAPGPSPEQRLARRLAAGGGRGGSAAAADPGSRDTGGRSAAGEAPHAGPAPAPAGAATPAAPAAAARMRVPRRAPTAADEPVWHGPGSGDPAPPVRIRADLAAGTIRPTEAPEPSPSPATARAARERPLRARTDGRRERPLRAR